MKYFHKTVTRPPRTAFMKSLFRCCHWFWGICYFWIRDMKSGWPPRPFAKVFHKKTVFFERWLPLWWRWLWCRWWSGWTWRGTQQSWRRLTRQSLRSWGSPLVERWFGVKGVLAQKCIKLCKKLKIGIKLSKTGKNLFQKRLHRQESWHLLPWTLIRG